MVDLRKGYYQISIVPEDQEKTAFLYYRSKYHFTRKPFGLRNGPALIQQLIDDVLRPCKDFSKVYIDDVVIFSGNWEEHMQYLADILNQLPDAGLTANMEKCQSGMGAFEFLGHIIGNGRISLAQCKTQAIRQFPRPKNKKEFDDFCVYVAIIDALSMALPRKHFHLPRP